MKKKILEVLIITNSVVLQQGLGALLESFPEITNVKATKELSNAYAWIEAHQPKIVLLDMAVSGHDSLPVLERIQILSPKSQRILLVDQADEVRWVPQHAEAILIKGASPSTVARIVMNLLSAKGEENEHDDSRGLA